MSEHRADAKDNGRPKRLWPRGLNGTRPERALPLEARLRDIGERIHASEIDELWVFPPLPDRELTCEFIVLSCFDGPGRRRIVTAHVEAEEEEEAESLELNWVQRLREHGTAPAGWVSGIPNRLLRRLSEAGIPQVIEVGGEPERWSEAITRLAAPNGNGALAVGRGESAQGARAADREFVAPNGYGREDATRVTDSDADSSGGEAAADAGDVGPAQAVTR